MDKMKAASSLFRSVRERNGDKSSSHRRNRSSEPVPGRLRPLTTESWLSIFKPESAKQAQKEKEEEEKLSTKIEAVTKRLQELNYNEVSNEIIRRALNSKFAAGDCDKAVELIQLQQQAFSGIILPYDPNVEMQGAENRGNVTCYLDALLFAMFAKLSAFECMLKNDLNEEAPRKLAALLRLWVNMLRSGKLIHTDLTQMIQETLAACGWKDAELLEQQDTSEAFAFITETLQLPLLALQVDLFHQGKKDADDHKVVHERLLNLAVPPDSDGKGIKLEDCLEEYFNNKVDVLRDTLEEKKSVDIPTPTPKTTIRLVTDDDSETPGEKAPGTPLQRRWTLNGITQSPVSTDPSAVNFDSPSSSSTSRTRSTSIIQRIVVDGEHQSNDPESRSLLQRAKRTGSNVVKAVTIPAWQFFRLIPWHAASNGQPKSDLEVAQHFNQRPMVGICLKRYTMTPEGIPKRQNTLIDIPDCMRLPHFMVVDEKEGQASNGLSQEYKLVLQSVVCHRGDSLHSGHYVAFARVAPKLLTDNRRHDHDPPPDYEEEQWVMFDDLSIDKRVTYVDDIRKCLREEMPYLLFYQIVPMFDFATASTDGSVGDPPSYVESTTYIPGTPSVETNPNSTASRPPSSYFDSSTTITHSNFRMNGRLSSDIDRPPRFSLDEDPYSTSTTLFPHDASTPARRGSISFSEPANGPSITSAATAPVSSTQPASPAIPPQDDAGSSYNSTRLSRAAARFTKSGNKSRPTSQMGENRISLTMSRLGFSRRSGDASASSSNNGGEAATGAGDSADGTIVEGDENGSASVSKEKRGKKEKDKKKDKDKNKEKEKDQDKEKDAEKDKEQHRQGNNKKERKPSKSRDRSDKNKRRGSKEPSKSDSEPDRECIVM